MVTLSLTLTETLGHAGEVATAVSVYGLLLHTTLDPLATGQFSFFGVTLTLI